MSAFAHDGIGANSTQRSLREPELRSTPRTMWSLSNAFTSSFKALEPVGAGLCRRP
jgi:hypothetical protein